MAPTTTQHQYQQSPQRGARDTPLLLHLPLPDHQPGHFIERCHVVEDELGARIEQLPVSAPRLAAALLRAAPFAPQLLARVARAAPSPELSAAAAEVRLGLFSRLVSF